MGQAADCTSDFFETFGSCGVQRGGDDDEDEADYRSRKRAKRTSGGGAWRAYVWKATHREEGLPDLKFVGQLYNKLSNDEMARLKVLGLCGTMAHKDDPHKKAFGHAESTTRKLDRRGEVAALAELKLHDDDAHRLWLSLQETSIGKLQRDETAARWQKLFEFSRSGFPAVARKLGAKLVLLASCNQSFLAAPLPLANLGLRLSGMLAHWCRGFTAEGFCRRAGRKLDEEARRLLSPRGPGCAEGTTIGILFSQEPGATRAKWRVKFLSSLSKACPQFFRCGHCSGIATCPLSSMLLKLRACQRTSRALSLRHA